LGQIEEWLDIANPKSPQNGGSAGGFGDDFDFR